MRNRTAIIEAVAQALLSGGADVSLEAIARRAGVGSATLHRNFPSRRALLDVVFEHDVGKLCALAPEIAERYPKDEALLQWLAAIARHCALNDAVTTLVQVAPDQSSPQRRTYADLEEAGAPLLRAAIAVGAVRADVSLTDLLALVNGIAVACSAHPDAVDRLFDLVWDGGRSGRSHRARR